MPNWKKLITSGSNASLNSLSVATSITASIVSASSGITGSLFGTASWATNVVNNGVTSIATSGTVSGITLTGGTITSTGTITLGGSISGLTNSNLSGTAGITNANLANSSVSLGSQTLTLGAAATTTLTGLTSITATSFTGSLLGTASVAVNAQTASFLPVGTYSITSSQAINAQTASNITPAITNNADDRVLTSTGGGTINGESNLTFDGNDLTLVNGNLRLSTNKHIFGGAANILGGNFTVTSILPNDILAGTASFTGAGNPKIELRHDSEFIPGGITSGSMFFKTPSGSGMTYTNEGRLGIGVSDPTNTLEIQGNVSASSYTGSLFGTSSFATSASFAQTASFLSGAFLQNGNSFGATAILGTNDTQNLQFETNGSVRMTISISGNVGIGTTSPTNTLNVSGSTLLQGGQTTVRGSGATSATTALRVENSAATARLTILDDGTSAFNTSHLYVSGSGIIGIGTSTPTMGVLDINGITRIRSTLYFGGTGAGDWQGAISGQASGLLVNANLLTINNSGYASPATQSFLINTSQNVAIGPHSPTARLHISGASANSLLQVSSPSNANILFVTGSGRVGINTTSSAGFLVLSSTSSNNISTFTIFQNSGSGDGLGPAIGLQVVNSGSSANAQANISIVTVGDKFASLNIGTSGSGTQNNFWQFSKRNSDTSHAFQLYNSNNGTFSSPLFSFVKGSTSTLGENNQIQIDDANNRVGLQVTPSEWIHLSSDPADGKHIQIDAEQAANYPLIENGQPDTAIMGYAGASTRGYLSEPYKWIEIKIYTNEIVLIPCYLPE